MLEDDILVLMHRKWQPGNKQEGEMQLISSGTEKEESHPKR